jgi:hypothetical protein
MLSRCPYPRLTATCFISASATLLWHPAQGELDFESEKPEYLAAIRDPRAGHAID